jgi:predicted O-methyltransferase YrrM
MSAGGTARYADATHVPPLVVRAVVLANELGFEYSCLPEQGRLLRVLAAGRSAGRIGETGTGCGVGLAWMVSGASPATTLVSVERDEERAARASTLFANYPNVTIVTGDWTAILEHGPFDLLVLDGGGAGKGGDTPVDPDVALTASGTLVIDDFTPATSWPPLRDGAPDDARLHWLEHSRVDAAEIRTRATSATIVATRRG